ncbi:hypothetical protein DPMN_098019 [Dreissena polymorpha]|uniref:Uncharacterized protein n=1 Tax=Dreissena polymorpha TaxID=45954 RepID=A0A9D4R691_DREPO|nr:hypothetical protein DPMN_098019 [Dreissena polymorpha]
MLGPYCQAIGLDEMAIDNNTFPDVDNINNGVVLELKSFCDARKYTDNKYIKILSSLTPDISLSNERTVLSKINRIKDQKICLQSKKKVSGYKNVNELLQKSFCAPAAQSQAPMTTSNSDLKVHAESETEIGSKKCSKEVQTEICARNKSTCDDTKQLNVLKHQIKLLEQSKNKMTAEFSDQRLNLVETKSMIGHYSVKNVNKRDQTARTNLNKLRDLQRLLIKQNKSIYAVQTDNNKIIILVEENACLKNQVQTLTVQLEKEKGEKVALQKANSYLRCEVSKLCNVANASNDIIPSHSSAESLKQAKLDVEERDLIIAELEEEIDSLKSNKIKSKNERGMYSENIHLCIMELAGLEVAVEKMSPVIQVVMRHVAGKELQKKDLPSSSTSHNIVDEGHYIAKVYIANRLENCESWGLC